MRVEIRYQSNGGNTRVAAEAIGEIIGVEAKPFSVPLDAPVDLLILGGGVYAFGLDKSFKAYLEGMDAGAIKSVAAFSTGGFMSVAAKIAAIAKSKGITVCEKILGLKMGGGNNDGKGKEMSDKHLEQINGFLKAVMPKADAISTNL